MILRSMCIVSFLNVAISCSINAMDQSIGQDVDVGYYCSEIDRILACDNGCINALCDNGNTMLHEAVLKGIDGIVLHLLKHKANVNVRNKKGNSPLHYAVWKGHLKIAGLLLQHKASVNIQDNDNFTALHIAVRLKNRAMIDLLLTWGANSNIKNNHGYTALEEAQLLDDVAVVQLLQERQRKVIFIEL